VIDACVSADGEAGILALLRQVHGTVDPAAIPGLWLPGRETNPTCLTDFSTNPLPDYNGLDLGVYRSGKASIRTPFLLYRFVNGCPQRCAFCSDRNGQTPGILPPERIVSELRVLRDRYDVHDFMFMNNMFNPTPRFTEELLDAFERADLGIRWCDCGRPAQLTDRQIDRLWDVGCRAIVWGVETGSQRLADLHHKNWDMADVERVLRRVHDAGIHNYVNVIVGMPHETEADFDETRRFLERNAPWCDFTELMTYVYMSGSDHHMRPRKYGILRKGQVYDEVGGQRWPEHLSTMQRRLEIIKGDFWSRLEPGTGGRA